MIRGSQKLVVLMVSACLPVLVACGGTTTLVSTPAPSETASDIEIVEDSVLEEGVELETSSEESEVATPGNAAPNAESGDGNVMEDSEDIAVDKGLLSTEVRIPWEILTFSTEKPDDLTPKKLRAAEEEMQASFDEGGWNFEVSLDGDLTVTLRMSQSEFSTFKDATKKSVDEMIQKTINEESNVYKSVTYTDDMKEFEVVVNRKALRNSPSLLSLSLIYQSGLYQALIGVDESDMDFVLYYIDEKTGKVFDTL